MLIKYLKFLLSSKLLIDQFYILKKKKNPYPHSLCSVPTSSLTHQSWDVTVSDLLYYCCYCSFSPDFLCLLGTFFMLSLVSQLHLCVCVFKISRYMGKLQLSNWLHLCVLVVKNPPANAGDIRDAGLGWDPWVGKIPWRRAQQPTPVFLPVESLGQRSLVGYSP